MILNKVTCETKEALKSASNLVEKESVMNILEEAKNLVDGQRQKDYGNMRESFNRVAKLWGGYLGMDITWLDVAHLMIMLKVSRGRHGFKRDSLADIIGYSYCADKIYKEEFKENSKCNGEF